MLAAEANIKRRRYENNYHFDPSFYICALKLEWQLLEEINLNNEACSEKGLFESHADFKVEMRYFFVNVHAALECYLRCQRILDYFHKRNGCRRRREWRVSGSPLEKVSKQL